MAEWKDFIHELDIWRDHGLQATFWWRDDDAVALTVPLRRLLDIAHNHKASLALAVIPSHVETNLVEDLNTRADVPILQHGYDHANHAPAGEKKSEFPHHRSTESALQAMVCGRRAMEAFHHSQPILVPPWNRIAPAVLKALPEIGFNGVSLYGARTKDNTAKGLRVINTHVDIIDWRGTRGFVGTNEAVTATVAHLQARRSGARDVGEATGLLSHHLVHDEDCWQFIEAFLGHVNRHAAAHLIPITEVISP